MSKRKSTNGTDFASMLSMLVILVLVVSAVGFLFIFTNNFTTELKNFYVKCGGDSFIDDRDNFDIVLGKEYKFEVVNTLGGNESGYIVSITSNEKANFVFKVDGTDTEFKTVGNIAKGFSLSGYDDYFTFTANMDLQEILQLYYPAQTLTDVPIALDSDIPYFTLTISSKGMAETININFNLISE